MLRQDADSQSRAADALADELAGVPGSLAEALTTETDPRILAAARALDAATKRNPDGTKNIGRGIADPNRPEVIGTARGPAAESDGVCPILDGERRGNRLADVWVHEDGRIEDSSRIEAHLSMPWNLLSHFIGQAVVNSFPFQIAQDVIDKIDRRGSHYLGYLTQVFRADGSDLVRCRVALQLTDDPHGVEPWEEWLDLPAALVGQMIESVRAQRRAREKGGMVRPVLQQHVPRWAGSHSFKPVIEQARALARTRIRPGESSNPPRPLMSMMEANYLQECHVVTIDPEQVAVLPEWGSAEEVIEYGAEAELPFESVYIDFEGAGGIAPLGGVDIYDQPCPIRGALMFRRIDTGHLTVAVIGWPEGTTLRRLHTEWTPYETLGWFVFDDAIHSRPDGEAIAVGDLPLVLPGLRGGETGGMALSVSTSTCAFTILEPGESQDDEIDHPDLPGYAVLPTNKRELQRVTEDADDLTNQLMWWSHLIWVLTKKAMAALSIVEAEEVILVDAPMERRDLKRAKKRGWPIAQHVLIRPSRRRADGERVVSGKRADFSHRFWVRGHNKHFPLGTRMATARPDLVKPCPRIDMATNCGFCRRVWTPPFIKGPDDKPLVLKTLHTKKRKADA